MKKNILILTLMFMSSSVFATTNMKTPMSGELFLLNLFLIGTKNPTPHLENKQIPKNPQIKIVDKFDTANKGKSK